MLDVRLSSLIVDIKTLLFAVEPSILETHGEGG
jgi:hypothetical protein